MLTRPDPWGPNAVEIATRKVIPPASVGRAQAHLPAKPSAVRKQPSAAALLQLRPALPIRALVFLVRVGLWWEIREAYRSLDVVAESFFFQGGIGCRCGQAGPEGQMRRQRYTNHSLFLRLLA